MIRKIFFGVVCSWLLLSIGCGIYSFTGASVDAAATTVNVKKFLNEANYVNPTLADKMTEELKNKITSQTKLSQVNSDQVDYIFDCTITKYGTSTVAVQDVEKPASARLTIAVKVKFTSNIDPDDDFSQTFSRSEDFSADKSLDQVQDGLVEDISKELVSDIFNKAFVNW